jgi:hypothetical protein
LIIIGSPGNGKSEIPDSIGWGRDGRLGSKTQWLRICGCQNLIQLSPGTGTDCSGALRETGRSQDLFGIQLLELDDGSLGSGAKGGGLLSFGADTGGGDLGTGVGIQEDLEELDVSSGVSLLEVPGEADSPLTTDS